MISTEMEKTAKWRAQIYTNNNANIGFNDKFRKYT